MDYIENFKLTKANIHEIFRVPLSILGTSELSYSNAESSFKQFQLMTLNPIMMNIEQELTLKLGNTNNDLEFKFESNSISFATYKEKTDGLALDVNTGLITPNEARKFKGLPPIAGGDKLKELDNKIGEAVKAPKNTDDTNPTAEKVTPPSKQ